VTLGGTFAAMRHVIATGRGVLAWLVRVFWQAAITGSPLADSSGLHGSITMLSKQHVLTALQAWIRQRPGLEFCNYGSLAPYRAELRQIAKDKRDAELLLTAVALRDSITAEDLIAAFPRAYSGRWSISEDKGRARLQYCTGQYWPTEYRKAACAVLASVLWDWQRSNMPGADGKLTRTHGPFTTEHDHIQGVTPGDWLRNKFRREFGRSIQKRWFN